MRHVAAPLSDDTNVQVVGAEAMTNIDARKLSSPDGTPAPGILEIVSLPDNALSENLRYPGTNQLPIRALEASPHPEKAAQIYKIGNLRAV